jgi:hypothetical protein
MDSRENQEELKNLITLLSEKLEQLEDARKKDLVFEIKRGLYLEIKTLNQRLQKCLERSNLDLQQ